jgi:cytochrome c biogenesis protein
LRIFKAVFALLTSTKLGIVVMTLLVLLSLLGVSVPQGASPETYREMYGGFWGGLVSTLGISNLFRTDYFAVLLVFLCVMVFACALKRLPRAVGLASRRLFLFDEGRLRGLPERAEVTVDLDLDEAVLHVADVCKHRYYAIRRSVDGDRTGLYASKAGFAHYGSFVLHVSFILLLAGGIAIARYGRHTYREVRVGNGLVLERTAADSTFLRVDDFYVETDDMDRLSDYVCEVALEQGDSILLHYRIRPNHPLEYRGMEVFLSSYAEDTARPEAFAVSIYDSLGDLVLPHVFAPVGSRLYLDEIHASIEGTVGVLPGVRLFYDDGRVESFMLKRDVAPPEEAGGRYQFVVMYGIPSLIVTLEVVREPFQGLLIAGLVLLTGGIFVSLYLSHRRIWFIVTGTEDGKSRIVFGGNASRNPEGFSDEFRHIRRTLDELV